MIKANDAKIEDIISKLKTLPRPAPRLTLGRPRISQHRVAAAKMVEAALVKSGLDVAALNKLMAEDRREGRKFLKENLSKTDAAAATVAHQQRVVEALKSSKLVYDRFSTRKYVSDHRTILYLAKSYVPNLAKRGNYPGG
jgi:hypothetical protein